MSYINFVTFSTSQHIDDNEYKLKLVTYARAFNYIKKNKLIRNITNITEQIKVFENERKRTLTITIEYDVEGLVIKK